MAAKKKAAKDTEHRLIESDPKLTEQQRQTIAAVKEYQNSVKVLDMFIEENAAVMRTYRALVEEHNQKLQVADQAVRGLDVSYGPWKRSEAVKYDADELIGIIGQEKFFDIGGVRNTVTVYSIEPDKVEIAIAKNEIVENEAFKKVTPRYHAPKPKG